MPLKPCLSLTAIALSLLCLLTSCKDHTPKAEEAILKQTEDYTKAYNKHDAKALATFWAEDASFFNPETGEKVEGRNAIESVFQKRFERLKDSQLEVNVVSITLLSDSKALVTGSFIRNLDEKEPQESAFRAIFEKQNGNWVITKTREVDIAPVPDQYQHLKDLEWLIGEWIDEDEDVNIETEFSWNATKNFINQKFSVVTEGFLELDGQQVIGWDPLSKTIRSWTFDSDGGFGESTWTYQDNRWIVETAYTLADGTKASAIDIYTQLDQDSYKWESTGREVGGQMLPDIDPITVIRKKKE